jgi:diguanylate cyclase (GGDEF)-like protein/PAS domain S-box-containing protein
MMEDVTTNLAPSVSSDKDAVAAQISHTAPLTRPPNDPVLYQLVVDSLSEYAVFAVSPSGAIISWYAGADRLFGYTSAEILGHSFDIIFTPDDVKRGAPNDELRTALSGEKHQHDRWHVRKDQTRFWGSNTVRPIRDAAGVLIGFSKLVRDISATHDALEALSDSEQQLRLLVESLHDYAFFSIGVDGTITNWNAGGEQVFGYTPTEIIGRNFAILFSPDDVNAGVPQKQSRKATINGFATVERWMVRKDGSRFLASGKLSQLKRGPSDELRGFVKIAHDITDQHAIAQALRHQAQYDELTDLPNRRLFYEHLQQEIALMKRRPFHIFGVLFIDIDAFKVMNDTYGHIAADEMLSTTARRLEQCVRTEDVVARIGGDEFAILLKGINGIADAHDASERIRIEMLKAIWVDDQELCASVSVGIAIATPKHLQPDDIMRDADAAMYIDKAEGRARSVAFPASTNHEAEINLAMDVHRAIERNQLRLVYQPIVRLSDSTIAGFEALVRWQHPRRGLLQPVDFIPLAEQSDLIFLIDRWMIREAAAQFVKWQAQGMDLQLQLSINVSSKEFATSNLFGDLSQILESSGLGATSLRLEITESSFMEQSDQVMTLLAAIRTLGVRIDIDDFGTGYASLSALQHVSVDALKIDSSFVATMFSENGAKLIASVITLAHDFGIVATAEGVETAEQLTQLVVLGCDFGQGFFIARPLDADAAGRFKGVYKLGSADQAFHEKAGVCQAPGDVAVQ